MRLKIEKVLAHLAEMRIGFTYSTGTLEKGRAIIWEVVAGPHVGLGECQFTMEASCPGMTVSAGEGGPASDAIRRELEPRVSPLIGRDAMLLEALLPELPRQLDRDVLVVREGLSIALYDLVGKAVGLPVHTLLGGKRRDRAPGMPVIHVAPPEVMVRRARAWLDAGYRFLKVKFRGSLDEDVEAMRGIREIAGPDISIQVDANDGYKEIEQAEKAIRALEPFGVAIFEDMLAAPIDRIADMRRRTGVPIMVDREAYWPFVHDVIKAGAADIINHHPNNQGGLATALAIDAVAAAAGLVTAVGSSGLFGIQDAAFQALSSVVGLSRPCEDIGLAPYYSGPTKGEYAFDNEPSVVENPYPIIEGVIHIPNAPGLGIEINRTRLQRFAVGTIEFS